jgi:hypothetical protein
LAYALAALTVLAMAVLPWAAAVPASASPRAVPGKDDRAPGRPLADLRVTVPCDDPVQDLTLAAYEDYAFADTTAGEGVVDAYGCEPAWDESGPEHVYVLTASEDLVADAWLLDNDPDLDLVVLSDCESDSCLAQANSEVSIVLGAGETVYLVVDGFDGAAGAYDLRLQTRAEGVPDSICAPGGAEPVAIDQAFTETLTGDLFGTPNLVSIDDCSPLAIQGGELWYALAFAPADTDTVGVGWGEYLEIVIEATANAPALDLALWLYDGCGPDAVCLAFADATNAGGVETLEWSNPEASSETVYLAVDSLRPVDQELGGGFELEFGATVPVRVRSLGELRELFDGR